MGKCKTLAGRAEASFELDGKAVYEITNVLLRLRITAQAVWYKTEEEHLIG